MDGISLWNALSNNETSPRTQMLHNIDGYWPHAAVRVGDYKLIKGEMLCDFSDCKKFRVFWTKAVPLQRWPLST